jgi:hypothetical protein
MRALLLAATMLAGTFAATPTLAAEKPATPAAAALPADAGAMPEGKLGNQVVPKAYRLDFNLDPAQDRFSGHTEIDVTVNQPGRYVWMHGRDLAVKTVAAKVGARTIPGTFRQADETGVALLTFAQPLPAGAVTLVFDYDAAFNGGPTGLFHVHVDNQWYSWSQFESIDARAAFPAFDQPGFKTPYTVTITTPAGQRAVSNAPEVSTTTTGTKTVHHFAPTLPLPSYLVAVMAGPFVSVDGAIPADAQRARPLPLRVISTRPNADKLTFALEGTKGIVTHLENYFGQAFPFPKLDQITAPIMPGAMENAGADLYEDRCSPSMITPRPRRSAALAWSWPTNWRTSGSATWSARPGGTTSGSTRALPTGWASASATNGAPISTSARARWPRAFRRWAPTPCSRAVRSTSRSPATPRSTPPSTRSLMARAAMSWR